MITREADYAIRVVLSLSNNEETQVTSTAEIAEAMFIPYRFLRKIVRRLCQAGIVGATRGKDGGIFLVKKPESITVHDILEIFDPNSLLFNRCYQDDCDCSRQGYCTVHIQMKTVQEKLNQQLQQVNFAYLSKT